MIKKNMKVGAMKMWINFREMFDEIMFEYRKIVERKNINKMKNINKKKFIINDIINKNNYFFF